MKGTQKQLETYVVQFGNDLPFFNCPLIQYNSNHTTVETDSSKYQPTQIANTHKRQTLLSQHAQEKLKPDQAYPID